MNTTDNDIDMNKIEYLIELYFEGATSLKDESMIREFFAATPEEELAPELKGYREYFCYMDNENAKMEGLKEQSNRISQRRDRRVLFINIGSVAAAVVILISIFNTIISEKEESGIVPENREMISLVINGEKIEDDQKAIGIVDDKLAKLNSIFARAGERTQESLQKGEVSINSISKATQAISESMSKADRVMNIVNEINVKQ